MLTARERTLSRRMEPRDRHLKLLTETIEAVNSTLDLAGGARARRDATSRDALEADACFVYLYDERADELVLRATHGTRVDEMTRRPRMRPGEGITGSAAAERAPVMLASQAHLDPRFKNFPNLPEDEYESILAVPILTRDGTLEGALNVRTREPRAFARGRGRPAARDRGAGRAVDRAREALRGGAAARARARGARADLGGGLRVALPRGVARGDRQDDDGRARRRPARRSCSTTAGSRGRRDAPASTRCASRCAGAAAQIGELVADRATPFTERRARAARVDRDARGRRARARPRGHARRARARDPPPREEQPADGRVAAAAAGALDRRDRPARGARALGQPHPRDRRGARAADRAARRGRRPRAI